MATGRIEKGQPLAKAISAAAWNRAQDAADAVLGVQAGFAGGPVSMNPGAANVVLVRNMTSSEIKASGIIRINGINTAPEENEEFPTICTNPVFFGGLPDQNDLLPQAHLIALEPIAAGKVGRAACAGVVAFRLDNISKITQPLCLSLPEADL